MKIHCKNNDDLGQHKFQNITEQIVDEDKEVSLKESNSKADDSSIISWFKNAASATASAFKNTKSAQRKTTKSSKNIPKPQSVPISSKTRGKSSLSKKAEPKPSIKH